MKKMFRFLVMTVMVFCIAFTFVGALNQVPALAAPQQEKTEQKSIKDAGKKVITEKKVVKELEKSVSNPQKKGASEAKSK